MVEKIPGPGVPLQGTANEPYKLDWITDCLAVGQAPMSYNDLESIRRQGINAVLNLCAEFCDLHWIEADAGFEVYFYPIPDEEAPDLPGLEKALDWLDECLFLGKKVLIHCRFGIGRTGTVVNAYLLRKGLGHKLAEKKLKGLKSKPASFDQWWFLRKYGKQERPLTIREPSLETKHLVDLFPFFRDYQAFVQLTDQRLIQAGKTLLCGQGHEHCCREPVVMTLIEAVYLSHCINTELAQMVRREAIERAVEVTRRLRELQPAGGMDSGEEFAAKYRLANLLCPLNKPDHCLLFKNRPLACRLFDLSPEERLELVPELEQGLAKLSREVWFAFTSSFSGNHSLTFFLSEVVSGRFVQSFFHQLLKGQ